MKKRTKIGVIIFVVFVCLVYAIFTTFKMAAPLSNSGPIPIPETWNNPSIQIESQAILLDQPTISGTEFRHFIRYYRAYRKDKVIYSPDSTVDDSEYFLNLATPSPDEPVVVEFKDAEELRSYFNEVIRSVKKSNCSTIKDKKRYVITLGGLDLTFKKGALNSINGLKISRGTGDAIAQQIYIFDNALFNICTQLARLDLTQDSQLKYAMFLIDKQTEIVEQYSKYKIAFDNQDEKGIEELVKKQDSEIKEIPKTVPIKPEDDKKQEVDVTNPKK